MAEGSTESVSITQVTMGEDGFWKKPATLLTVGMWLIGFTIPAVIAVFSWAVGVNTQITTLNNELVGIRSEFRDFRADLREIKDQSNSRAESQARSEAKLDILLGDRRTKSE